MRRTLSLYTSLLVLASLAHAGNWKLRVPVKFKGPAYPAMIQSVGGEVDSPLAGDILAVWLSSRALAELRIRPEILVVEQDGIVSLDGGNKDKKKKKGDLMERRQAPSFLTPRRWSESS